MPENGTSNRHALLIGVDLYLPNKMPNGSYYPSLGGCVRDITHVRDFLIKRLGMDPGRILTLSATNTGHAEPPEARAQWPTYENMVARFEEITTRAQPGDQVYLHYSGHGGRAATAYPNLKGANGFDEALVPTDIGQSEARYLRDLELAHLLTLMVDKGLTVTVVLDSCHSGGATKGLGGAVARQAVPGPGGQEPIDTGARPTASLVASPAELAATWARLPGGTTRALKPASGWLLEPQGYTLLAACRASESAYEFPFDGLERNGALTYWLLDSLKQISPGLTYKAVHDRILAKVHGQFVSQTPQLQGIGDRVVFGSDRIEPSYSVLVMQVEGSRIQLGAGQNAGLRKGAEFALYPQGVVDFTRIAERIAVVKVAELGAVDSWAEITHTLQAAVPIEQGAPAVLLDPANVKLKRSVRVLDSLGDQRQAVEQALADGGGFLALVTDPTQAADYQVTANAQGEYEIWDAAGSPVPNLRPVLPLSAADGLRRVVQRLSHLAKFTGVRELDNRDSLSPLAGALTVELLGVQDDYDPVDGPLPTPFQVHNTLQEGQWTFLRIKNNLQPGAANDPDRILNITILDLQPGWAVKQVFPAGAGLFEPLDPQQELVLPLRASLPAGYSEGTDIVKVFASLGTPNLRWLELPNLDQPVHTKGITRSAAADPLDQLLAAVAEDGPPAGTKDISIYSSPSKGWVTGQVEVHIKKVLAG